MSRKFLLLESHSVSAQLADLFDFVWPMVTALSFLRGSIRERLATAPLMTEAEIGAEFGAVQGARLRHAFHMTSAEEHEQQVARFLLYNICALYEEWADSVADRVLPVAQVRGVELPLKIAKNLGKNLQDTDGDSRPPKGLELLCACRSEIMEKCIYPAILKNKKYTPGTLVPLLVCYRYHKDLRNCLIHGGGVVDEKAVSSARRYTGVSAEALGVKEAPACSAVSVGDSVRLSLRGVVGLGDVVLRLVATIDAELSRSVLAETLVLERLRAKHGSHTILPSDGALARERVARLARKVHLPAIHSPAVFMRFLKDAGFVK